MSEAPRSHRFTIALAIVVAVGFVLRVGYVLLVAPEELGFDAIWYELQSQTLSHGDGYIDPDAFFRRGERVPTANFPPLWPLLLAGANQVGLDTERAHQMVGCVLGSITVALTGVIGRRVAGRRVGIVAAAIVAVSPMLIAADGSLMAESLYISLVATAVLIAYVARARRSWWWFAALGAVVGLAVLTRSDGLILAPALVVATVWRVPDVAPLRRAARAAIALLVVGLVLVPWTVRNDRQMGEPVALSSNSGSALEGANCRGAYAGELLGAWDARCMVVTRDPARTELEWAAAGRRAGIDYARDHASRLPLVAPARVARAWSVWNPVAQADLEAIESRDRDWQVAAGITSVVLLALAIGGTFELVRRRAPIAPLVGVVVGCTLAALAAYGNSRFTLAAQPAMAIAAAALLVAWWSRSQPSSLPTTDTNDTISPG
jgi:4-amino-4-deoxy-L-arabinose transferase-like glycosyltransferase